MKTTREHQPFSDMTRLCASVMNGTEEILKQGDLHMIVIIKDGTAKEFGVASNAEEDMLPMLLMTLIRSCGGKDPATTLLKLRKEGAPPDDPF